MRWGVLILLCMAGVNFSPAQYELTFSGYVLDLPMYQQFNNSVAQMQGFEREQFLNMTRVRLRPNLALWTNAELSAEYEITGVYSSAPLSRQMQAEQSRHQVLNLAAAPVNNEHFRMRHFIDRLQMRQGLNFGDLTVGRQRIAWGTGRIWNPTDLFNPLNPTAVSKIEKDGVDAVLLKMPFGSFTDLSMVYNPQKEWNTSNTGFRFRTNYEEFDLSIMGGYFDTRTVLGADCAGNVFQAGVRGEGILSFASDDFNSFYSKFIVGADYQFTQELYGMIEYHFNGEGADSRSAYNLTRLAAGEIINVGRNYLALSGSCLVHPLVTLSTALIAQLDDGSRYWNLSVSVSITDEIALAAGGQSFSGSELSEYWFYPVAAYVKTDIYF